MSYKIVSLNDQGLGICYVNDKITFVDNVVVDDIVELKIINSFKKYNLATVTKYIEKSKRRVDEFCPYYKECGGCHLQNLSYEDTLKFKKEKLEKILHKFANIDIDIEMIKSSKDKKYRNKITLKIENKKIGYYSSKTNNLVEINNCLIVQDSINNFIKEINRFNIINGEIIIRSNYNDELLINIISDDKINIPSFDNKKIIGIVLNDKVVYGQDYFVELINNKYFKVSYDSFFQINRDICSKLFNIINDNILENKNVLDLYSGVGTLGINVANKEKKVYGIEIIKNAVLNSITNASINKLNNCNYLLGDASNVIDKINDDISVCLIDPPRSGLSKKEIDVILKMNPKQIIYVSCDPITLARDLKLLKDCYIIKKIIGLDMFCYTHHLESVSILESR